MPNIKRLAVLVSLSFMLSFTFASAQNGQTGVEKDQGTVQSSTEKTSRPIRFRLGGFSFNAGYTRYPDYYPYYSYYPYYPNSFYRSWFYEPFYYPAIHGWGWQSSLMYHPGWYTGFSWQDGMGEIKLRSSIKDADVFIDDALAGKAKDLKTLWLEPGVYNLKVQADQYEPFTIRLYVLSGKTLKIDANLAPQKEP